MVNDMIGHRTAAAIPTPTSAVSGWVASLTARGDDNIEYVEPFVERTGATLAPWSLGSFA
jgi:hypothetical protein